VLAPAVAIGEGEAAVYARAGDGFELVDRIEPGEWATLGPPPAAPAAPAGVADSVVALEGPGGPASAFRVRTGSCRRRLTNVVKHSAAGEADGARLLALAAQGLSNDEIGARLHSRR
jgi:hypothetical protein